MGVLKDDWRACVTFLLTTDDTTQLALVTAWSYYSPLSRPATTVSWAMCKQNKSCTVLNRQPILLLLVLLPVSPITLLSYQRNMQLVPTHTCRHNSWRLAPQCPAFVWLLQFSTCSSAWLRMGTCGCSLIGGCGWIIRGHARVRLVAKNMHTTAKD